MSAIEFHVVSNSIPAPGLVLRIGETQCRYLRITHVFGDCVYFMYVSESQNVRRARRPVRIPMSELLEQTGQSPSNWGQLALPRAMSNPPAQNSESADALDTAWNLVKPLIVAFSDEKNLARDRFTALIRAHADSTGARFLTLQRMVLRYYYFGGTRLALLALSAGVKVGHATYNLPPEAGTGELPPMKRRGRQPRLASVRGANDFLVSDADISDMVASLKTSLRKGATYKTDAHEDYLAGPFKNRHPEIHQQYLDNQRLVPVTLKQYRYYTELHARLDEELARNLRTQTRKPGHLGSIRATGPCEIYEIDSTGGRIHLVSSSDKPVLLGTPTIYLIIDRWSRFVVSAYISLRAPSYEEVRHTLLIAFTSRELRFQGLGIDIDDSRWPVGRIPAVLCPDRGPDFMSEAMEQAVVQDLRIDLTPLPPFCPDGKAIVERVIRELKRRMHARGIKGVYADRPMDPVTKRAARNAKTAAVHSLAEAYRALIEFIVEHNNRPHSALRRRRLLVQAGVRPVPQDAYLWGLKHISGLRTPPLSDADYYRLLLSSDSANIARGVVRYKNRPYLPANEAAFDLARCATARSKAISIRLDKSNPHTILVPHSRRDWAAFRITPGAADELAGLTLDEEEARVDETALLWDHAEHESRIKRVADKSGKRRKSATAKTTAVEVDRQQKNDMRAQETADMKRKLTGQVPTAPSGPMVNGAPPIADWMAHVESERLHNLKLIRQQRKKR